MANKFVRNITGTKLTGDKKEPFYTNVQNDILSDDEDIYIRQEKSEKVDDNYHCLTDNIKTVQGTSTVGVSTVDKNTVKLNPQLATENEAIEGTNNSKIMTPERVKQAVTEHETETVITSDDETVTVTRNGKNNYNLSVETSGDINIISKRGNLTVDRYDNMFTIDMKSINPAISNIPLESSETEFWGFISLKGGSVNNIGAQGTDNSENFVTLNTMKNVMTVLFNKITALQDEIDALKNE